MKSCPRCGFHHIDTDVRCARCGTLLDPMGEVDPLADPDKRPMVDAPPGGAAARLANAPLRWIGSLRLAFYRFRKRAFDPLPEDVPPRSPWPSGFLTLLLPGLGQARNRQPRKAVWAFLSWIIWIGLALWTIREPYANAILLGGVLLLAFIWHDAFVTAVLINRYGEEIPWQHRLAYYFAWICYVGIACTLTIWIGYWVAFRRVCIFHNELAPWVRRGEWVLLDRFTYTHRAPRVGDIVYYNPAPVKMERTGEVQSAFLLIDPGSMIERVVAGPGDTYEYRDGEFYRNGRPAAPEERPLRTDQLRPFRVVAPKDRHIVIFSYTGTGIDPLPIHTLDETPGLFQVAPRLDAAGWILTNWEPSFLVPSDQIRGRVWLVYNPPPARRILRFNNSVLGVSPEAPNQ